MNVIRILLVDDHPIVRSGLRATLEADPQLTVAGEASSGEQAIELTTRLEPDLILMDLKLGTGIDGAQAIRQIKTRRPASRILVLTTYDKDSDILPAIEAGATGYLLKDTQPADLIAGVHMAARGETVLAPTVATRLVARMRAPVRTLTPRELQILQMVADGQSNQAIARELFITEATVKSHLVQVFTKLEVDNRTAAAAQARQRGLVR